MSTDSSRLDLNSNAFFLERKYIFHAYLFFTNLWKSKLGIFSSFFKSKSTHNIIANLTFSFKQKQIQRCLQWDVTSEGLNIFSESVNCMMFFFLLPTHYFSKHLQKYSMIFIFFIYDQNVSFTIASVHQFTFIYEVKLAHNLAL